jgi:HK97 family phage prohead protease
MLWRKALASQSGPWSCLGRSPDSSLGPVVKAELALESPVAQKAYGLLKKGVLKGLSIGYDDVKSRIVDGVRRLSEMKLWEVSLVTFPMNPAAQVLGVKTFEEVSKQLREFRETLAACRKGFGRG